MAGALDLSAILDRAGQGARREVREVALDQVRPDPANPRAEVASAELEGLAASILARGVLQPVTLYPADAHGIYMIRFGARRVAAARRAGLATIPAIVDIAGEGALALVDQIVENDQRVDLSPLEMADAVARLGEQGLGQAKIGELLGRSRATISMYAAVAVMPPHLRALLESSTLRAVYDLHQHWLRAPAEVDRFVARSPAGAIDRAAVARLRRGDPPAKLQGVSASLARLRGPERAAVRPVSTRGAADVALGGRRGRLVFDPAGDGLLAVLFENGEIAKAPSDQIRLIAVRPA